MARGGHGRSGPAPDPNSGRSDRRGYKLTALPSAGFDGDVPAFPLPQAAAANLIGDRELAIWELHWRTPQACAWFLEPWRWETVAEFCRIKAIVEISPDASAALVDKLRMYRDQIGMTPAGLRENGWAIAHDEVAEKRDEKAAGPDRSKSSRDRMKVVSGG